MKLMLVAFTAKGTALAARIAREIQAEGDCCDAYAAKKYAAEEAVSVLQESLADWTEHAFSTADGIVFVGACGIAVRSVAPFLKDKRQDPAVVVVDEAGRFAISLVSGHVGGANRLAARIAALLQAVPVITTATDVNEVFAVDLWARENGFLLENRQAAKAVSAALLAGKGVAFHSDYPVIGGLPDGLIAAERGSLGISISLRGVLPYDATCLLRPRALVLGIGCRRGTGVNAIESAVQRALELANLPEQAVCAVCSIDIKREEAGLNAFCHRIGVALQCYSAEDLRRAQGAFTGSEFVREITGVDNVCERAAVLGSENGTLLLSKYSVNGVTVAAAQKRTVVAFK